MKFLTLRRFLPLLCCFTLLGCSTVVGTTISVANSFDQNVSKSKIDRARNSYLDFVEKLKNEKDPLGEYLFIRAVQFGWIEGKEFSYEELLNQLDLAAHNGSLDAEVYFNVMKFYSVSKDKNKPVEGDDLERGMAIREYSQKSLLSLVDKQCWYLKPVISAKSNTCELVPISAASEIWPSFRDGYIYPKNPSLASLWKDLDNKCKQSLTYVKAKKNC